MSFRKSNNVPASGYEEVKIENKNAVWPFLTRSFDFEGRLKGALPAFKQAEISLFDVLSLVVSCAEYVFLVKGI